MRTFHQLPVGFTGKEAKQKGAMVRGQRNGQFLFQLMTNRFQLCQSDGIPRHADELVFKRHRHILVTGKQNLMRRTVVTGEVANKTFDNIRGESAALEKTANIEQVARVLAIHRGDEFAAVKFWRGQNRHGQVRREKLPGLVPKPACFHRQHRAAKNVINLDLHLIAPASDEQFEFVAVFGGGHVSFRTESNPAEMDFNAWSRDAS